MNLKLLFILTYPICFFGQGITLTSQDLANGGDTVRISLGTDNGYDFVSTGEGFNWDFSSLTANSQNLRYFAPMAEAPFFVLLDFGWLASSEYKATYFQESMGLPIAQITSFLPVSIQNVLQYSRLTSNALTEIGYSMNVESGGNSVDLSIKSDTIETHYKLPLNYGDSNFTRGYTQVDFNPVFNGIWNQHRTRATKVDGYGTLSTPYGTFDVLRVRHEISETDSVYTEVPFIGPTWIPLDLPIVHEYEWWTTGELVPILKITTNEVLGNETVSSIEYRENYLGLDAGLSELTWNAKMYPVPANDVLTVQSDKLLSSFSIFDQLGHLVKTETLGMSPWVTIETQDMVPGVYELRLFAEDFTLSKKFVKQ